MLNFESKFTLSKSQRSIEWKDSYIPCFEMYVNKIYRNTYEIHTFPKKIWVNVYIKEEFT